MALIECPDCHASVSDLAPACLQCGRPMRSSAARKREFGVKSRSTALFIAVVGVVVLSAGVVALRRLRRPEGTQAATSSATSQPGPNSAPAPGPSPSDISPEEEAACIAAGRLILNGTVDPYGKVQGVDVRASLRAEYVVALDDLSSRLNAPDFWPIMDIASSYVAAHIRGGQGYLTEPALNVGRFMEAGEPTRAIEAWHNRPRSAGH